MGRSDSQALATLGTTAAQYFATIPGTHTGTKAMGTFTFNLAGLKSSFHGRYRDMLKLSNKDDALMRRKRRQGYCFAHSVSTDLT
jgi:hypothetical protein